MDLQFTFEEAEILLKLACLGVHVLRGGGAGADAHEAFLLRLYRRVHRDVPTDGAAQMCLLDLFESLRGQCEEYDRKACIAELAERTAERLYPHPLRTRERLFGHLAVQRAVREKLSGEGLGCVTVDTSCLRGDFPQAPTGAPQEAQGNLTENA